MKRPITGYGIDEENDWFAYLSCGHRQHVRHRPPFTSRPWVTTKSGRDNMLGWLLNCVRCDRLKWPDGLIWQQRSEEFTEKDITAALARSNVNAPDVWVRIVVTSGLLRYRIPELGITTTLSTDNPDIVPPEAPHEIKSAGPVTFTLEFWRVPEPPLDPYD